MSEAIMLVDLNSSNTSASESYLTNERTITTLQHSVTKLGSGQMQVSCQRHSEDLTKWLKAETPTVDEGEDAF
jgi:hypothetical protein